MTYLIADVLSGGFPSMFMDSSVLQFSATYFQDVGYG
jgi:hypothetical protein